MRTLSLQLLQRKSKLLLPSREICSSVSKLVSDAHSSLQKALKHCPFQSEKTRSYITLFSSGTSPLHDIFLLAVAFYFLLSSICFLFFYLPLNYYISMLFLYSNPSHILLSSILPHHIKSHEIILYNTWAYLHIILQLHFLLPSILPSKLCSAQ